MHVNNNQISPSFDLAIDNQHLYANTNQGVINTKSASVIKDLTVSKDLTRSANSTNDQFAKLTPQNQPAQPKLIKASNKSIQEEVIPNILGEGPEKEDLLNQINLIFSNGLSHEQYSAMCGDGIVRADSPELHGKDPSEIGPKFLVLNRQDGTLALAITEDQVALLRNKNLTYIDKNGQTQRYSLFIIDNATQDRLQAVLNKFHNTHIAPLLKQKENDSTEDKTRFVSTCLKSVIKVTTQEKVDRRDNEPVDPKVQELADKVGLFFPTVQSLIIKKIAAEWIKEKEEIKLEKKNLEIIHKIEAKSIKLFASFQERIKVDHESQAIALSEQNHMRAAHSFKPIEHAKTTV